jgi:4-methyl-5(b-hydroxyethyl)-thiazole monophosphate biosynthesis
MDPKEKELTKKILVPIADGSEEIEAACIIDTLRRSGAEVTVASIEPGRKEVVCSRKMKIVADCLLSECKDNSYDMIVLPGSFTTFG